MIGSATPVVKKRRTRRLLLGVLLLVAAAGVSQVLQFLAGGRYSGPVSDHFDGERFFNPDGESGTGGAKNKSAMDFINLALGRAGSHSWPQAVPIQRTVPPRRVLGEELLVTWIGHSSALIQTQGLNILIDPVWSARASPIRFLGPRRVRAPGVRLHDLPTIDVVLISHDHYDHLDLTTLKFLATRDKPLIITGLGNDQLLARNGIAALGRDWGDAVPLRPGIAIVLTRAHHWSARSIDDRDNTLWTGFRLVLPGGDVYYPGDTGPGDMHWAAEAKGQGRIRFALLPLGPYKINTPPSGNHINPDEAVTAFQQLGAAYALGVHWGTFELGPEPINGPPLRLAAALGAQNIAADRFRTLEAGQSWSIPQLPE